MSRQTLSSFLEGLRSGIRLFGRKPAFAGLCVSILALGLGLSATLFGVVYSLLLRPLPFDGADRWVQVEAHLAGPSGLDSRPIVPADYLAWRRHVPAFERVAAYSMYMGVLSGADAGRDGGGAEVGGAAYVAADVTAELLAMAEAKPLLGRLIQPADEVAGAPRVALVDADIWRRHFGGRPDAIGTSFQLYGKPVALIGVLPAGFSFPHSQKMWLNLRLDASSERPVSVVGQLAEGSSPELAALQLKRSMSHPPPADGDLRVSLEPFALSQADQRIRRAVAPLLMAIAALLFVACANVASLLLGRAIQRSREMALRAALGARRSSILAFQLGECLVLACVAGGLGLLLARGALVLVERLLTPGQLLRAFWMDLRIDLPVVWTTVALAALLTALAGIVPVWRPAGSAPADRLREGTRTTISGWAAGFLVVVEVALATAMLVGGGLMLRQMAELRAFEPGFEAENRTVAKISLPDGNGGGNSDSDGEVDSVRFFEGLERNLLTNPQIEAVGFATSLPTQGSFFATWRMDTSSDSGARDFEARWLVVSPGFFDAAGIAMRRGRSFDAARDRQNLNGSGSPPAAIVNESFVERFLPGEGDVLRCRVQKVTDAESPWVEIVGVVADTVMGSVDDDRAAAAIYLPSTQRPRTSMAMVVAGKNGPPGERILRRTMAAVDPRAISFDYRSMESLLVARSWLYDLLSTLFGLFAGTALALTLGGIYGVVAATTRRRVQEYGIRLALGARPGALLLRVMRRSLLRLGIGVVLGLAGAALMARLLGSVLHGMEPSGTSLWLSWIAAAAVVLVTGLAASLQPALEAARVDPVDALRRL